MVGTAEKNCCLWLCNNAQPPAFYLENAPDEWKRNAARPPLCVELAQRSKHFSDGQSPDWQIFQSA